MVGGVLDRQEDEEGLNLSYLKVKARKPWSKLWEITKPAHEHDATKLMDSDSEDLTMTEKPESLNTVGT